MLLQADVAPLAYARVDAPWLPGLHPYQYQRRTYELIEETLTERRGLCLFLVTPTGSGKTLASYAYTIRSQEPAFGVYPTNELIRDQEAALSPWIDAPYRLLRIDSSQLDAWQYSLSVPQHAQALERLLNWEPTILTNPDILFYTFFGLYKGAKGLNQRLLALLARYRLFIFDEFHLYNVKQMADMAFLAASLERVSPARGRVFIFASATPESPALAWLHDQLHLPVEVLEAAPSDEPDARIVAHGLRLDVVPADLRHWSGVEALLAHLPLVQEYVNAYPQARIVTILDSVAGAVRIAEAFRGAFPQATVGEVHGLTSAQQRAEALQCPFTVGTSTIEVGIDFRGQAEKDGLIFEARTASQFVQRFGRLARHNKSIPIPNRAIALVPEYVYHYMRERWPRGGTITRAALYSLVEEAYQRPADFARYLTVHAPAEYQEARAMIKGMFQPDDRPRIAQGLGEAVEALTGASSNVAQGLHRRYLQSRILKPLLTFRGSGLQAAILDQRGVDPGLPAKRYGLMFLLRRAAFAELDRDEYMKQLDAFETRWPVEIARHRAHCAPIGRAPEDLLGVYGYFAITGLLDKTRKVWFEVPDEELFGRKAQIVVISGLEVATDPPTGLRRLNQNLRRKQLVAWFVDRAPASIQFGRALPPLFEVHELRPRAAGGALGRSPWSIVFNQDAFLVDSLGWWTQQRNDHAVFL